MNIQKIFNVSLVMSDNILNSDINVVSHESSEIYHRENICHINEILYFPCNLRNSFTSDKIYMYKAESTSSWNFSTVDAFNFFKKTFYLCSSRHTHKRECSSETYSKKVPFCQQQLMKKYEHAISQTIKQGKKVQVNLINSRCLKAILKYPVQIRTMTEAGMDQLEYFLFSTHRSTCMCASG